MKAPYFNPQYVILEMHAVLSEWIFAKTYVEKTWELLYLVVKTLINNQKNIVLQEHD
jgi:predicted nucleic-acid-binding protein